MKKTLIALAALAATGAVMAQSSVTLYGVVDVGFTSVNNSNGNNSETMFCVNPEDANKQYSKLYCP